MASEGGRRAAAPAPGLTRPPDAAERSSPSAVGSDVVLDDVERAVVALLGCYKGALKFAVDMPVLGRCKVSGGLFGWRWGARFYTRLYVETHVRKQLQAIRSCLRLELLGTTAPQDRERLTALEADLGGKVESLLGWRRLLGIVIRLPPVAAALPVLSAATAFPAGQELSRRAILHAVVVLVATALVLWVLVVWPSVRLGFRVKRAVFCGGRDLQHPFWYRPGELRWEGFAATKVYDDVGKLWIDLFRELIGRKQQQTPRRAFPTSNTYEAENAVYGALARRKPGEVPVDMLLGFPLYLWFAFAGLVVVWLIQTAAGGFDVPTGFWFLLLALLLIPVMPFNILLQAVRNYRQRWH